MARNDGYAERSRDSPLSANLNPAYEDRSDYGGNSWGNYWFIIGGGLLVIGVYLYYK